MREQSSISKFSEAEHRDLRKRDSLKRFAENRRVIQLQHQRQQFEEFNRVYPLIASENFKQHIDFIKRYVYNQQYNFMLVQHAQTVVECLIEGHTEEDGLFILEALSYFEEIQITDIEELAIILMENLQTKTKRVLNIIANLLEIGRYCQNLRDELINLGFIAQYQSVLANIQGNGQLQNYIAYVFTHICCCMVKSHPLLCPSEYQSIVNTLLPSINENNKHEIIDCLQTISQSFDTMPIYASILYEGFAILCENQYEVFNSQILSFLNYCARSEIKMRIELLKLLAKTLKTKDHEHLNKVLVILNNLAEDKDEMNQVQTYQKFQEQEIISGILMVYEPLSLSLKIVCCECLSHIMREFTRDLIKASKDKQDTMKGHLSKDFADLGAILLDNMSQLSQDLKQQTVQLLITILQTFQEQSITRYHPLMEVFDQNNLSIVVNGQYSTSSIEHLSELIDRIYTK